MEKGHRHYEGKAKRVGARRYGSPVSRRQFMKSAAGAGLGLAGMTLGTRAHAQARSGGVLELNTIGAPAGFGPPAARALEMFNEKNRGRIHVSILPVPWEAHYEKQMSELVAKSTAFDFFPVIIFWKGAMAHQFEDLTPYADKFKTNLNVFPGQLRELCKVQNRLWSLPFRYGAGDLLFYRKDLYAQAGVKVPTTLREMVEVSQRLTAKGVYGLGMMLGGHPSVSEEFVMWFCALGGRLVNQEQTAVTPPDSVHAKLAEEILSTWKELLDKKILPPGAPGWVFTDVLNGFTQGLTAQMITLSARVGVVESPEKSRVSGKVGYSPVFPGPGVVGPRGDWAVLWSYAVNKWITSERKEAAYKAIAYMTSYEAQLEVAQKFANGPTRADVLESPEYQKLDPAYKSLRQMMDTAYTMSFPQYWEAQTAVSDEIGEALTGKKTPRAAVKDIWSRVDMIMRRG